MINAKVRSDDHNVTVDFDATAWFEQAGDEDILDLAISGWGGDYPADAVSQFFSGNVTKQLFEYVESHPSRDTNSAVGHETYVDEDQAIDWLNENKPEIAKAIFEASVPVQAYRN